MMDSMTAEEWQALNEQPKPSKYRNVKTVIDGIAFDSKREARRYAELKLMLDEGEIHTLALQPSFDVVVNGVKVCRYIADFGYMRGGEVIYEDSKGVRTPVYRLKVKLVKAVYGVTIVEV